MRTKLKCSALLLYFAVSVVVVYCSKNEIRRFKAGKYEIEIGRAHRYELDFQIVTGYNENETRIQIEDDNAFKREICSDIPSATNFEEYRIYKATNKCYSILLGEKGPCGPNMLFYAQSGNRIFGGCDCDVGNRTLIYVGDIVGCFPIFYQAKCPEGSWLTLERPSGRPICKPHNCPIKDLRSSTHFVELNKNCVQLDEQTAECSSSEIVNFVTGKILPTCIPIPANDFESEEDIQPGGQTTIFKPVNSKPPCAPGSLRSISGRCQANWQW